MKGRLEFTHDDRRRIYDCVKRRGETNREEVRTQLGIDPRGFRHHVAILRGDGHIETDGEKLRVSIDDGVRDEFGSDRLEFDIRLAGREDRSGILGAIRRVTDEADCVVAESVTAEIVFRDALLWTNELELRVFFVATVQGEVVGWAHIDASNVDKRDHVAELTVGVLEEYRDHGIGSRLLSCSLEWAADNGYEKVYSSVPSSNEDARSFLEQRGWRVEAVREDHYKLADEYLDEVMMAYEL
ncbi:GNAT family N-acetyltransferase [Natribaculum luteum]|uniref:GNAT family N-acetyltransferase n=1 Tax=Natribaculum luteum TaxID=1586232 RepID=A0ABD5P1Y4_9EURY|nr:GNAT family N-acetyltransferase [Natribaculum luteum]